MKTKYSAVLSLFVVITLKTVTGVLRKYQNKSV